MILARPNLKIVATNRSFQIILLTKQTVLFSHLFRFVALPLRDYARSNISRKNTPSTDVFEYCWLL